LFSFFFFLPNAVSFSGCSFLIATSVFSIVNTAKVAAKHQSINQASKEASKQARKQASKQASKQVLSTHQS
jgi:hypothetical protein